MKRAGFWRGRPRPRCGTDTCAKVRSIKVTPAADADSRACLCGKLRAGRELDSGMFTRGTPWPSATTIHFVSLPFLVGRTQGALFWPGQSCRRQRACPGLEPGFRLGQAVLGDRGVSERPAMFYTRPLAPPRGTDAAGRCWEKDGTLPGFSSGRRCEGAARCLRNGG